MRCLSVDIEAPGLDFYHGVKPFLITTCNQEGEQLYWQVPVDPLTRQCRFSPKDRKEIKEHLLSYDIWMFQNPVFDVTGIYHAGMKWIIKEWHRIRDTGMAAHLVDSSNKKKDLTTLVLQYLNVDIQPLENAVKREVHRAQDYCRRHLPEWRIAAKDDPMLPSGAGWKADMWLLLALADELKHPEDHPWRTVGLDYALADTATTLPLGLHLERIIRRNRHWKIYQERNKLLKINHTMQFKGLSINGERTATQHKQYEKEGKRLGKQCQAIAKSIGIDDLVLPKSGNNKSLLKTVFGEEGFHLEPLAVSKKTGEPSLDKNVIESYLVELEGKSKPHRFLSCLSDKRSRDTACSFLTGYTKAWIPTRNEGWYVLHPSLNPVGTSTLRWSSNKPNSQNISKKKSFNLRHCFGPAPGREWWSHDYNNLELVIPFYESGEEDLIALFEKPNEPPYFGSYHLMIFDLLHPDKWDHSDPEGLLKAKKKYASTWYQYVKNGNFAVIYGAMEESGTADRAYHVLGAHSTIRSRFEKLDAHNQRMIDYAEKYGYVETIPDRSVDPKRGYPLVVPRDEYGRIKPTMPLNYRTQGCLAGSSRVVTSDGLIPIQELVEKSVKVWTGFKWADAVGLNRGKCERAEIQLESGLTIKCDTRHKLKNENDEWVSFRDLQEGDYVALPREQPPVPYSGEMSWWFILGYIIGDGCVTGNRNRKIVTMVGGELKKPLLEEMGEFIEKNRPPKPEGSQYRGKIRFRANHKKGGHAPVYEMALEDKPFAELMESFGLKFGWRSSTKRIPESVWRASAQEQRDFMEGLWLSDGTRRCKSGSGKRLNMNNPELLKEVQILVSRLGFDSTMTDHGLNFRWRAFNSKSSRKYPAEALVNKVDGDVVFARYRDNMGYGITDRRNFRQAQKGKDISQYVAERILRRNTTGVKVYRYDKIVSIKTLGREEDTYTLSVDDPLHQFVADGVIHKNTAMQCTSKAMIRVTEFLDDLNQEEFGATALEILADRKLSSNPEIGYFLTLQVHDEIVTDLPRRGRRNLPIMNEVERLMRLSGDDIGIPLRVSTSYHLDSWAQDSEILAL